MVEHTWLHRAKCDCGFIWTTRRFHVDGHSDDSLSVGCACGKTEIRDGVIVQGSEGTFTEQEFKQAVADDLGINVNELELIDGGTDV